MKCNNKASTSNSNAISNDNDNNNGNNGSDKLRKPLLTKVQCSKRNKLRTLKYPSEKTYRRQEIQQLLVKLKDLVPSLANKSNKKLTKLDIIQNAIDYIFDLEMTLKTHPSVAAKLKELI